MNNDIKEVKQFENYVEYINKKTEAVWHFEAFINKLNSSPLSNQDIEETTLFNTHDMYIEFVRSELMYCQTNLPIVYDVNKKERISVFPEEFTDKNYSELQQTLSRVINTLSDNKNETNK